MPVITSAHNPRIQRLRQLAGRSKERRQEAAFLVEGVRLVEEALAGGWVFDFVLYDASLSQRGRSLLESLRRLGVDVEEASEGLLASSAATENPQGLLGVVRWQELPLPERPDFVLVLDQLRDPGNLGSLLRSASAAGVQAAYLSPGCADAFSPKVVRAAMGALFRLPIRDLDWERMPDELAGLSWKLADMDQGTTVWQADLCQPMVLVIGGEAEGASAAARQHCSETLCIPMQPGSESLNAAAAGAVLMLEVRRQRTQ